jgi:hypothetical protein
MQSLCGVRRLLNLGSKISYIFFAFLLTLCAVQVSSAEPVFGAPQITNYNVDYHGRSYNAQTDRTTFSYTVSGTGVSPELNYFVTGTGHCNPGLNFLISYAYPVFIGTDSATGTYGIKWEQSLPISGTRTYTYSVRGNVPEGPVRLSINAGQQITHFDSFGAVCADSPQCVLNRGSACSVGNGICANSGTIQCDGTCSAIAGNPNPLGEICGNQLDDDCDNNVDEISCVWTNAISGKTLFQGTLAPVAGVQISTSPNIGSKSTNASGSFSFNAVPNGSYTLSASKNGYAVVSNPNPVIVSNASRTNLNFILTCASGFTLAQGYCVEPLEANASDGTFMDFVRISWNSLSVPSAYSLYRSEIAGQLGTEIASGLTVATFDDSEALPNEFYFYTVVASNGITSNQDEGWRPGDRDKCPEGEECIFEGLEPSACANANGFLGQVNIATIVNRLSIDLVARIEYRDLGGIVQGSVNALIKPSQKLDILVNELGLKPDTYGTVCVFTDTEERGAWSGGVALYKSDDRNGPTGFGTAFDFVLYYPFTNPRSGSFTVPLNTTHLGVRSDSTVANWVSLTDAIKGDGLGLRGVLEYFNQNGKLLRKQNINIPDGGRFDYSGHEGISGIQNSDAVGIARFTPDPTPDSTAVKYYISTGRYYYQCLGASCNDFYTAFVIPNRPATTVQTAGGVATNSNELSVIEFSNFTEDSSTAKLEVYSSSGASAGVETVNVPGLGTTHVIINKIGANGYLAANTLGSATAAPASGSVSAVSIFYKLNDSGELQYAYAAPFVSPEKEVQFSEFNSFIDNINSSELFNATDEERSVQISAHDAQNNLVLLQELKMAPKSTKRIELSLPKDTYGTLVVQSDAAGVVFRNYVAREGESVLSFSGQ